jgi:pyruvate,orthophosphate dikinase
MPVKSAPKRLVAKHPSKSSNGSPKAGKKTKMVYYFGGGKGDGDGTMKPLLGGKGANLAEMTRIGLPVPPGFTITTEVCTAYYASGKK